MAPRLSTMQRAVMVLVVKEKTDREIGLALGRSPRTIEKHMVELRRKLGARSRVGVAVAAVRLGL
jgi:DNA-binding NarL/FixJ family response regulator